MTLYPDVQQHAQLEVDRIVAQGRLPSLGDEKDFTYVSALIKEILRFQPVTRTGAYALSHCVRKGIESQLGLPHRVIQDDHYSGYYIPKGSTVISNIW
jgi:cytochrome P450